MIRLWRPQSYYDVEGRGTRARDGGGVLITQGIHTLDLMLSLAGPVAEVTAYAVTSSVHRMETEDMVAAADCVIVVTDHSAIDFAMVKRRARLVVDTRNATRGVKVGVGRW